jgi:hypothetical protein
MFFTLQRRSSFVERESNRNAAWWLLMTLMKKATHEITIQIQNNKRNVKPNYTLSGETTQRQEQSPTKYTVNPGYLNTVPHQRQQESPDSD